MSSVAVALVGAGALAVGVAAGLWLPPHARRPARIQSHPVRRILLPFTAQGISDRALEAAVRLAGAEGATLVPAFLATVPRAVPLSSRLPAQCSEGMPLLEAIEQRAAAAGVPVDARVSTGRTYRDALRRLLAHEPFDRVVVSATTSPRAGLTGDDLTWLLNSVPSEVLILRPAPEDTADTPPRTVSAHV
jgi:hypothetical protein